MEKFYSYFKIIIYFLLFVSVIKIIHSVVNLTGFEFNGNTFRNIFRIPLSLFLIYILIGILRLFKKIRLSSLFSSNHKKAFKKFGYGILLFSILTFTVDVVHFYFTTNFENNRIPYSLGYSIGYSIGKSIASGIPMVLISIVFIAIAELIEEGYLLKKENDLTI